MNHEALEARLRVHLDRTGVAGAAVAVMKDGDTVTASAGAADLEQGLPLTAETLQQIASVTKPMVATVVARLAARGLLGLDDPIGARIPEVRAARWSDRVTIRHLLANTGGIPMSNVTEFAFEAGGDDCLARLAEAAAAEPPLAESGEVWSYTNLGWSLLGRVIEVACGTPWEDAMRAELFGPLGMTSTAFAGEGVAPAARSYLATGGDFTPAVPWSPRAQGPAGSTVWSTAGDLARFAAVHLDDGLALGAERYAPPGALEALREAHARVRIPVFLDHWCLGWARFDWPGGPVWGWDGVGSGFRAILRIVPARRGAVALIANSSNGRALYRSLFPEIMAEHFGVTMPPLRLGARAGAAGDLSRFEGTYAWTDTTLEVRDRGEKLEIAGPAGVREAAPLDEREFLLDAADPDAPTVAFGHFDDAGRPRILYRMVWGLARESSGAPSAAGE